MLQNVMVRFGLVFTDIDLRRIYIVCSDTGDMAEIQVDLHGLSRKASERLVNNVIALVPQTHFSLVLIHGYTRGHALKDLFNEQFVHPRVAHTTLHKDNPGRTMLVIT